MNTKIKLLLTITTLFVLTISSCVKKDFDQPELPNPCDANPGITPNISILDIKLQYNNFEVLDGGVKIFPVDSNYVLKATVISSDEEGNFYKEIYLQDSTASIKISIDGSPLYTDYNIGQEVYIKLSGLNVEYDASSKMYVIGMGLYNGSGIGRIPVTLMDQYIFRKSCPKNFAPIEVTISSLSEAYVGKLIKIKNVQFLTSDTANTYADAVGQTTVNHNIIDCQGNQMIVRTSGYANFAGTNLPNGGGSIIGIYGIYNTDKQLYIRKVEEVIMDSTRCN